MELPEETTADVVKRLRRVEGQVRGVARMLEEGADCRDVLTQLAAATKALQKAGFRLLTSGLSTCLQDPAGGPEADEIERLFTKLA